MRIELRADESFGHALFTRRNPFEAAREALLGRTAICRISSGSDSVPPQDGHAEMVSLAQDCQARGRYEEAIRHYREALAIPHSDNPVARFLYASALVRDGRCRENAAPALEELGRAEREIAARAIGDREYALLALIQYERVFILPWVGREEEAGRQFQLALENLKRPLQKSVVRETAALAVRAGLWTFGLYVVAGRSDSIRRVFKKELANCQATNNSRGGAKIYFELGFEAHHRGSFKQAFEFYNAALDALRDSGDESLPIDGPVEQTNWAPFLRLMIMLCKASLKRGKPGAADPFSSKEVGDDIARISQSRPKGLNLKHAFELLSGLASTLHQGGRSYAAMIHLILLAIIKKSIVLQSDRLTD